MKKVTDVRVILFWKTALITLGSLAILTCFIRISDFVSGYVLDMVGPAMGYILLRVQYTSKQSTFLSFKFTPGLTALLMYLICFLIETSQYFNLYDAYFDPWDYLAYISILIPCYLIDRYISKHKS